jgi:alkaline phosphatase
MKWWVALLAVLILMVFGAIGMFYVRTYVEKRPHGIILLVANGLDLSLLQKARQKALARGQALQMDRLDHLAVCEVKGYDQLVPDEAAASTALASGKRVRDGLVGVTMQGQRLDTLIYAAQRSGRATGLVTTSDLTMPTPLAFYGQNSPARDIPHQAAAELIDSGGLQVILGGGSDHFQPAHVLNENGRRDGRNLLREVELSGYEQVRTTQELERIATWRTRRLFGVFAPGSFTFTSLRSGTTSLPTLAMMTRQAIRCLQYNLGGYFLVVEHGLVAAAARHNWTELALNEVAAFDSAVQTALEYSGNKSLVIVTNNFSLGALDSSRDELLSRNAQPDSKAIPRYEWLTGPGAIPLAPSDKQLIQSRVRSGLYTAKLTEPTTPTSAIRFAPVAEVTTAPAWLGARGLRAERFAGFYNNSDLYDLIREVD